MCIIACGWCFSGLGFSDTYVYELYLHNEYYSEPPGFPSKFALTPIVSSYTNCGPHWREKRFSSGVVESLRLTHKHLWIEFMTAFGEERVRFDHAGKRGEMSRFGLDDFLIDVGYNFLLDEKGKAQILLHWLTGIPLRWKVTEAEVEQPLFGIRAFATGPVIEFAYDFIRTKPEDLFIGFIGRFLHRFKRSYQPILPPNAFFHPGNAIDLVALLHYRYNGHNFEAGYVSTFYTNLSYQFPHHNERLPSTQFNSLYCDYEYYHSELSMAFEAGVVKTFGKTTNGTIWFGLVSWYF